MSGALEVVKSPYKHVAKSCIKHNPLDPDLDADLTPGRDVLHSKLGNVWEFHRRSRNLWLEKKKSGQTLSLWPPPAKK